MMADGRMLKKEIANSKKLELVSDKAKVIYFMMLPHTDIKGRVKACPQIVKGQYLTMLKYTERSIQTALNELHKSGLVVLYIGNGDQYAEYTRFDEFQKLNPDREAKSRIPAPALEDSGANPEESPLSISLSISKVKSKLSLSKGHPTEKDKFDIFWKEYPKKRARPKAMEMFCKIKMTTTLFATIMAALKSQKRGTEWVSENGKFIPWPAKWLKEERWTDEMGATRNESGLYCKKCKKKVSSITSGLCRECQNV